MAMFAALKHQARGLADLERQFRRDQAIRTASNPVRTEIIAAHMTPSDDPNSRIRRRDAHISPVRRPYNAFGAKMSSKNMMNDYGDKRPGGIVKHLLILVKTSLYSFRLMWRSPLVGAGCVTLTGSEAGKVSSSPSSSASSSRRFSAPAGPSRLGCDLLMRTLP